MRFELVKPKIMHARGWRLAKCRCGRGLRTGRFFVIRPGHECLGSADCLVAFRAELDLFPVDRAYVMCGLFSVHAGYCTALESWVQGQSVIIF